MMPVPRRVRIVNHSIDPRHGDADACLNVCIDWRWWNPIGKNLRSTIEEFRIKKNWRFVPIDEAGGAKLLASDDPADAPRKNALLQRIEQELGLHHPGILALSVHRDCGAYGYFKAFDNDHEQEDSRLIGDLYKAKQICEQRFGARVRIECYIFDAEGVEDIIF